MATDSETKPSDAEVPPRVSDSSLSDLSDSHSDSNSDSDDGKEANARQVEWLATTRERRSTAGNRMKSMLANEEPDSELELLFAEDENDEGFSDAADDASDMHMDSSSDDEDENKAADDLEGEKELDRQAKERRAAQRKRRAQEAIPVKFRKKVRIDPVTAPAAAVRPAPRPKKKSERTSWLPSVADLPTRASSRQTTRLSKEQLHQQMVEREERRLKQLAQMQKKAAKLEAMKKPPMTQEERLREAAIVEKRNGKSLNRWEVAEKQREEERRAKLAALNERTLKGPFITFWSGMGEWVDGRLKHVGRKHVVVEEKPQPQPKKKREREKDKPKEKYGEAETMENKEPVDNKETSAKTRDGTDEATSKTTMDLESTNSLQPVANKPVESPAIEVQQSKATEKNSSEKPEEAPKSASPPDDSAIPPLAPKAEEAPPLMAMPALPPPPPPPSTTTTPASGLAAPVSGPASASAPVLSPSPVIAPERPASVMTPPPGLSRPPPESKPSGVLALPVLAPPPGLNVHGSAPPMMMGFGSANPKSNVLAPPDTSQGQAPPILSTANSPMRPPISAPPSSMVATTTTANNSQQNSTPSTTHLHVTPTQAEPTKSIAATTTTAASTPNEPSGPEHPPNAKATRNAIVFQNFDENAIKEKSIQTQILFGRKMNRLAKPSPAPHCVITNHPARYRDPATGLPYYNAYAYREIQRLCRGDYRWSQILGAWVGTGSNAAKGVPERFLNPKKPTPNADDAAAGTSTVTGDDPVASKVTAETAGQGKENEAEDVKKSEEAAQVKTEETPMTTTLDQTQGPPQPAAPAN